MQSKRIDDSLREALKKVDSLSLIARENSVDRASLSRFRDGKGQISLKKAASVAAYLGLEVAQVRYLASHQEATAALTDMIADTTSLKIIGRRSQHTEYLEEVAAALEDRRVGRYYRLLNGTEMTNQLAEHLQEVIEKSGVDIRWTKKTDYPFITVTDDECLEVYRVPAANEFFAKRLTGSVYSVAFSDYFMALFNAETTCQLATREDLAAFLKEHPPKDEKQEGK